MNSVDRFLSSLVTENQTPSVHYCFFNQRTILHQFIGGLADIESETLANGQHLYHLFSTTKTFTALAILQLAEKKLLHIDEPAAKYLPSFQYGSQITIKNLLNHTAGIPNPIPLSWIHLQEEHELFKRNNFFRNVIEKHKHVISTPNQKFAYSNLGYVLLGQIIEQVSGLSYEQYIQDNIITRIDATSNELTFTMNGGSPNATGYHKHLSFSNLLFGFFIDKKKFMGDVEGKWQRFNPYYINGTAYGGLLGTAGGFVKYVQSLLGTDSILISENSKKLLFEENTTDNGKPTGMCLSWYTAKLNGKQYYTHAGGGGGYYCEIRVYPSYGVGSVILFNRTGMTDKRILNKTDIHFLGK